MLGKTTQSINVGLRLKVLREERGVSMRELARRSGLSANALSMIERNLTSPSVSTLTKLATALEVPITAFFRTETIKSNVVFRKGNMRTVVPFPLGSWEGFGGDSFAGNMESYLMVLEAGGSSGPYGLIHSGHEFVYCLSGLIDYEVGEQHFLMEAGDSLIFAANIIHRWHNPGNSAAKAVIVISSFEENEYPGDYHLASIQNQRVGDIPTGNTPE